MAALTGSLKIVVVTPEKALLEREVDFVVLPLFDGELGVCPGHAPFVGQLAPGELRLKHSGLVSRFFVDGGFAQVRNNIINVLTPSAVRGEDLVAASIEKMLVEAEALPRDSATDQQARQRVLARARGMQKVAGRHSS